MDRCVLAFCRHVNCVGFICLTVFSRSWNELRYPGFCEHVPYRMSGFDTVAEVLSVFPRCFLPSDWDLRIQNSNVDDVDLGFVFEKNGN